MSDDSEFMCAVVRIVDVQPHPNADRLDLCRFTTSNDASAAFPYQIVTGRGEFSAGQLGVYISPDSEVPLSAVGPFAFLRDRLDARGKDRYRIRSARLRGLFSPGLLVPLPGSCVGVAVGVDISKGLGVAPWSAPGDFGLSTPTATKGAKGYQRAVDPFPIYSVTALKKVPNLFEADYNHPAGNTRGEEVVITEKIHGCNFRFGYGDSNRFFYGTHRTPLVDVRGALKRIRDFFLRRRVRINAPKDDPWTAAVESMELREVAHTFPQLVFYGELFGLGVQDLQYGQKGVALRIFDCWHGGEKRWLTVAERGLVMARAAKLGLVMVPPIYNGPYSFDLVKQLAEQDSVFGGIREGVVIEAVNGTRRKAKWVSERYHMRKG